ncbi:hypothetical protein C1T31_12615 [Hanstruepera neustonica]|uniref:Uncharacterized protein n=1 Tax=Hanstruepera neustonica TaxID=1445657 RepID=A0A2K1DVX6_9FLAO|nr:hypothetical protein C1T31_12615 [Hanstruepera neustonica]
MLKRILSAKINYLSILIHVIGALFLYAIVAISIFFLFYFFLDKGLGTNENKTNGLATNLIFYVPLFVISSLMVFRAIAKAKKSQHEISKTILIALIISIACYLYFWLN